MTAPRWWRSCPFFIWKREDNYMRNPSGVPCGRAPLSRILQAFGAGIGSEWALRASWDLSASPGTVTLQAKAARGSIFCPSCLQCGSHIRGLVLVPTLQFGYRIKGPGHVCAATPTGLRLFSSTRNVAQTFMYFVLQPPTSFLDTSQVCHAVTKSRKAGQGLQSLTPAGSRCVSRPTTLRGPSTL